MLVAMRWLIILVVLFHASVTVAEVYRWIDDRGRVTYSDQPVPGAQRIAAPAPAPADAVAGPAGADTAYSGPYEAFEILAPEHETVASNADLRLNVGLLLVPGLMPEHRIQIFLDGAALGDGQDNTQFSLRGLSPGTHQLQARVVDAAGAVVAATSTNRFHLRPSSPNSGAQRAP